MFLLTPSHFVYHKYIIQPWYAMLYVFYSLHWEWHVSDQHKHSSCGAVRQKLVFTIPTLWLNVWCFLLQLPKCHQTHFATCVPGCCTVVWHRLVSSEFLSLMSKYHLQHWAIVYIMRQVGNFVRSRHKVKSTELTHSGLLTPYGVKSLLE